MRILTIFTGGTIGCASPDEKSVLSVESSVGHDYFLINNYFNPYNAKIDTIQPLNLLSENMTISDWNVLLLCLKDVDFSKYDGVIITHGTDTMAFTASIFGMILAGVKIPVIFIGSNFNLQDERADGHQNFADAVSFIKNAKLGGTFVIAKSQVYLSTRITQSRHFTDSYGTPTDEIFGIMKNDKFEIANDHLENSNANFNPNVNDFEKIYSQTPLLDALEQISDCVFLIRPYVGLNYENFTISDKTKAILHETYHSCTACAEPSEPSNSVIEFYNKYKNDINLYIAPFYGTSNDNANNTKDIKNKFAIYSSTDRMLKAGIKTIDNMSLESAYAKLLLAYSLYYDKQTDKIDSVDKFLTKVLFFESIA